MHIVDSLSGTHPLIKQANELIDQLNALYAEMRSEQDVARQLLSPCYEIGAVINEKDSCWYRLHCANYDAYREHLSLFGSVCNMPEEVRISVAYYRVGNVLLHRGGGYLYLHDAIECPDSDWLLITAGKPPIRYIR